MTDVEALRVRHGVTLDGEEVRTRDGGVRPARSGVLGTRVDKDVTRAAGSSFKDEGQGRRSALAIAGQVLLWGSLVGATVFAPVPLAAGLFAVSAVDFIGARAVQNPVVLRWALPFTVGNALLGTLLVAGVGGLIIAPALVTAALGVMLLELARTQTLKATWLAVDAYNRSLRIHLQKNVPAPPGNPVAEERQP